MLVLVACSKNDSVSAEHCVVTNPMYDTAILLVAGQSNAANAGSDLYTARCTNTVNFYLGEFRVLKDPLLGANGTGGSVWSRMADDLLDKNFANFIIIAPAAVGGSSIQQWIPGGDLHEILDDQINSLNALDLIPTHVLWHQGESNNAVLYPGVDAAVNASNYTSNFMILVDYLRGKGIQAPIFPAVTTRCASLPIDPYLQAAQQGLASDSLGIFNGPNTDNLGFELRYDDCHFDETGLYVHAALWANILLNHE